MMCSGEDVRELAVYIALGCSERSFPWTTNCSAYASYVGVLVDEQTIYAVQLWLCVSFLGDVFERSETTCRLSYSADAVLLAQDLGTSRCGSIFCGTMTSMSLKNHMNTVPYHVHARMVTASRAVPHMRAGLVPGVQVAC